MTDKPLFDARCVLAQLAKQRACRVWVWSCSRTQSEWVKVRVARRHAQLVYEDAERVFTKWSKSLLTNIPNPRKWWSTVETAVFGASSSLPPLADRGRELVWSADEKASLFSAHFDAKLCREFSASAFFKVYTRC